MSELSRHADGAFNYFQVLNVPAVRRYTVKEFPRTAWPELGHGRLVIPQQEKNVQAPTSNHVINRGLLSCFADSSLVFVLIDCLSVTIRELLSLTVLSKRHN